MNAMASQITGVSTVYSTFCSGADQRKHTSSASLAIVRVIHRLPVNSLHKGPVTRKIFPFDDVIMEDRDPTVIQSQHLMAACYNSNAVVNLQENSSPSIRKDDKCAAFDYRWDYTMWKA